MEPKMGIMHSFTHVGIGAPMHQYSLGLAGVADAYNLLISCQQPKSNEFGDVIWRVGILLLRIFVRGCMCTFQIEHKGLQ